MAGPFEPVLDEGQRKPVVLGNENPDPPIDRQSGKSRGRGRRHRSGVGNRRVDRRKFDDEAIDPTAEGPPSRLLDPGRGDRHRWKSVGSPGPPELVGQPGDPLVSGGIARYRPKPRAQISDGVSRRRLELEHQALIQFFRHPLIPGCAGPMPDPYGPHRVVSAAFKPT